MANPALIRATPTNSHDTKMASIFRDAADGMEEFETLSKNSTSYDQRFRVPISQARTTPFGIKNSRYLGDFDAENSPGVGLSPKSLRQTTSPGPTFKRGLSHTLSAVKKPIKTGLGSHEMRHSTGKRQPSPPRVSDIDLSPSKVRYPRITKPNPRVARSSRSSSMASDCHSSHGVPLVIPLPDKSEEKMNSIDTWLTEVRSSNLAFDGSPRHSVTSQRKKRTNVYPTLPPQFSSVHPTEAPDYISNTTKSIKHLAEISNNKENAPPQSSPVRASPFDSSALMRSPASVKLSPTRLYSALSLSPHSPLRQPPRRIPKAFVSSNNAASGLSCPPSTPFTIHEDDWGSGMSPLSPNVEVHRKGRSPKRDQLARDLDRLLKKLDWEKKNGVYGVDGVEEGEEGNEVTTKGFVDDGDAGDRKDDGFWTREDVRIGSRKKKVLGVSERSEEWTREKPFVEQADGAQFGFRARPRARIGRGDGGNVDGSGKREGGRGKMEGRGIFRV